MGGLALTRLLLDTQILLWSLLEPSRLTATVASELEHPGNELWLSPNTTWEVLIFAEKRQVNLAPDSVAWVRSAYLRVPFKEAPLNHEVAIKSLQLDLPHRDPADRFLVATALVYGLTLVTADRRLLSSPSFDVLPNL